MFGAAATVLSLAGSWIPSLWGDEAASVMSAERPLPSLFRMLTHVDAVHGTYYLGLHFWIALFGASPFSVRLPSAFAAGLAVAAVVLIAYRLSTPATALTAGVICCGLPRITYMGLEARPYAFDAALVSWLTLLLLQLLARERTRRRWWVLYGALYAFGIYLFLYIVLFGLVHAAIVLRARPGRRVLRAWVRTAGIGALAATPVAVFGFLERSQIRYLGGNPQVTVRSILVELWFGEPLFAAIGWTLVALAAAASVVAAVRRRGTVRPAKTPSLTFVGICWLVIPSAVLIGSQFSYADFTARYLTFCAPAAALLMARGLVALTGRRYRLRILALAGILAAAAPIYLAQRGPYAMNGSDWAEVSRLVGAHARPGDGIVFDESVRPSRRPQLAVNTYPEGFRGLRLPALKTPYAENDTWYDSDLSLEQAFAEGRFAGLDRVWLVDYATGGHGDRYGMYELEEHGYHLSPVHYETYHALVYLFRK